MTDYELGAQHGKLGNESKYPNNANYAKGFRIGTALLLRELQKTEPFESMTPSGISDAHCDQYNA